MSAICKIASCKEPVKPPRALTRPEAGPESKVVYTVCERHYRASIPAWEKEVERANNR